MNLVKSILFSKERQTNQIYEYVDVFFKVNKSIDSKYSMFCIDQHMNLAFMKREKKRS